MLETLRKLPPNAKRRVALVIAGIITLMILASWSLRSSGALTETIDAARGQGIAIFDFFDQNVERVYTAFQEQLPDLAVESTTTMDRSEAQNPNF